MPRMFDPIIYVESLYSKWLDAATGAVEYNEEQGSEILAELIALLVEAHNGGVAYLEKRLARNFDHVETFKAIAFLVDPKERFRSLDSLRKGGLL